ncbi:hypothetical protein ABIF38_008617 [Bradyrhizobium japonicum]|jgi:hypothetical protein|uniref:Integron gene cassette protein n=1 Tax=Bradyrhizobium elkanii TaxID=29448 RepID=A0ABV4EUE8_BRAEL|nr:hypothetical protein [Bradyrhizobium elkanii]MCS4007185.1 hypothetical protein [Bradyrhizobium elkanii USDA 61]MCP1755805.1 hypothetical protein [Bradyrhizobium elkanii]MCP1929486.1 hypothetical protein [Bradyrhizobium elkanii]MCP1981320.1 hypothetical protein [Bradyrhizobium elkanii]
MPLRTGLLRPGRFAMMATQARINIFRRAFSIVQRRLSGVSSDPLQTSAWHSFRSEGVGCGSFALGADL